MATSNSRSRRARGPLIAPECHVDDVAALMASIESQRAVVAAAEAQLRALEKTLGPVLEPIAKSDLSCLMPAQEYEEGVQCRAYDVDDGDGYWATATHRSSLDASGSRPAWASHVLWFNR